ncbi:MAG: hypothetical protein ACPGJS_13135 [Flammeovirgaceae bacterium]
MAAKFVKVERFFDDKETLIQNSILALEATGFTIKGVDERGGFIWAKTGVNMWSWGEEILVSISADGNVSIKSECVFATQIFDWGKNKKNVYRFFENLAKIGAVGS